MKEVFTIVRAEDGTEERIDWTEWELRMIASVYGASLAVSFGDLVPVSENASIFKRHPSKTADLLAKLHRMGRSVFDESIQLVNDERCRVLVQWLKDA